MRNRMSSVCDQLIDFLTGIVDWLWDTVELVFDILLEFVVRGIELAIAILHLGFQVVCFLRDLCIEAMQTFANVFRGVVNVVSSIKCEDVEDFATACIVVLLWIGAVKVAVGIAHRITNNNGSNNIASRILQSSLLPLPDIFAADKSRRIKLPGRHYSRKEQKQWTIPNPMIGLLGKGKCPHAPRDKIPNLIKDTMKKKIIDARRRGGKQPKNSSVSSASSGSSYTGD